MISIVTMVLAFLYLFLVSFIFGRVIKIYYPLFKYSIPLGFYFIFFISQIFMYLFLLFDYKDADILSALVVVIGVIALVLLIIYRKRISFEIHVDHEFFFIIILFIAAVGSLCFFSSINASPSDSHYYLSHMIENSFADELNVFNPFNGFKDYFIPVAYRFQTYYYVVSGLFRILNFSPYLFAIWILPITLVVVNAFTALNILDYFKIKNKVSLVLILSLLFNYFSIYYGMNGAGFKFAILSYLFILFKEIYEGKNTLKNASLVMMLIFSGLAFHSSFFFQASCIITVIGFILLNKSSDLLKSVMLMSIPLAFYLPLHFEKPFLFILLMLIYGFITIIIKRKKGSLKFFSLICKISFITGGIIIYLFGFLNVFNIVKSDMNYLNFFSEFNLLGLSSYGLINGIISMGAYLVLIIYCFRLKFKDIYAQYILLFTVFFFNPLSIAFVSKYITGEVYFRLQECLIQVPALVLFCLITLNFKKIIFVLYAAFNVLSILLSYPQPNFYKDSIFSFIYRVPESLIDMAIRMNDYSLTQRYEDFRMRLVSSDLRIRLFTKDLSYPYSFGEEREYQLYQGDFYYNPRWNLMQTLRYSEKMKESIPLLQSEFSEIVAELVVVDQSQLPQMYDEILKRCSIVYQNDDYVGYNCPYRYYKDEKNWK